MSAQAWRTLGAAVILVLSFRAPGEAACTISTTSVNLGVYDVFAVSPVDSTGTIAFVCAPQDRNISITLTRGSSSTFNPRTLQSGGQQLAYNLYMDAAHSAIWGDGTGGTQLYANAKPPNKITVTLIIYARIPTGQDVSAGSYSDSIVAVVNF